MFLGTKHDLRKGNGLAPLTLALIGIKSKVGIRSQGVSRRSLSFFFGPFFFLCEGCGFCGKNHGIMIRLQLN
jgi:hypothetical protein